MANPFYDPDQSYQENFQNGPFGDFASDKVCEAKANSRDTFLGHPVDLPFGIPAGPLLNGKFVESAFQKGFDLATYKTVRTREYPCHPWPNVLGVKLKGDLTLEMAKEELLADNDYGQPLSITNSFGVPSMTVDWWQEDMKKAAKSAGKDQVMIGSFQGTADGSGFDALLADYVLGAKLVKETGAKILEANLSCPNEGKNDLLCFDVEGVTKITEAIKNEIGNTPLILKLAYFETDEHLRQLVTAVGKTVDGLAAINTIPAAIVDEAGKQALPGEGRLRSGVCGSAIQWAGREMTTRLKELRGELGMKFAIIGVGGVTEPVDFKAYQEAGADAVMSATGAMWNPQLACTIKSAYGR
jgi:dihydroorotate dehydrogenase